MRKFHLNLAIILFCAPFITSCSTVSGDFEILDMHLQGFPLVTLKSNIILRYFEGRPISELIAITGTPQNTKKENGETTYSWSNRYTTYEDESYDEYEFVPDKNSATGSRYQSVTKTRSVQVLKRCDLAVTFNSNNIITKTEGEDEASGNECGEVGMALARFGDKNRKIIISDVTQKIRAKHANRQNR